jgi:predicted DNA-binding transcriptional regulator YafY
MKDPIHNTLRVVRALLDGETVTSHRVAELTGVKEPAGRKYIDAAIKVLGAKKVRAEGRHRAARLERAGIEPPSREMAMAAGFGSSLANLFEGSTVATGLRAAVRYVLRASPNPSRFASLERKFFFVRRGGEMALPARASDLQLIIDAVLKSKQLRLRYRHFDGKLSRSEPVEPLSMAVYDHQLYLIARRKTGEWKPYRFSRIEGVARTGTTFRYPTQNEYDPSTMFRDSFGIWYQPEKRPSRVRVRLHPRWRAYALTHRWCDGQSVKSADDGVTVDFTTTLCPELEAWVLGFGGDAEVLEPKELREAIGRRANRAKASNKRSRRRKRE